MSSKVKVSIVTSGKLRAIKSDHAVPFLIIFLLIGMDVPTIPNRCVEQS